MSGVLGFISFWFGTAHGLPDGKTYFYVSFFGLMVCVVTQVWENHQLSKRLKPAIKVGCGPEIEGCAGLSVCKTNWAHRIKIKNHGVPPVEGCEARLTDISANGFSLWRGNYALLTFAPSHLPDKLSKTLLHDQPNWIDTIFTCRDKPTIRVGTEGNRWDYTSLEQIFDHNGQYHLTVDISSRTTASIKLILVFAWQGDWTTASLRLQSVEPKEARDSNP